MLNNTTNRRKAEAWLAKASQSAAKVKVTLDTISRRVFFYLYQSKSLWSIVQGTFQHHNAVGFGVDW